MTIFWETKYYRRDSTQFSQDMKQEALTTTRPNTWIAAEGNKGTTMMFFVQRMIAKQLT